MLPRLFEASEEVNLNVNILRILCQLDLIPRLSLGPSSRFAMTKDLLINVQDFQMSRYSLQAIRLVDLSINFLESLKQTFPFAAAHRMCFDLTDMLLEVKESP